MTVCFGRLHLRKHAGVCRLRHDSRGQALVLLALLLIPLLSFTGLTIDVGLAYVQAREAQAAADAAALAAADDLPGPNAPLFAYQTALATSDGQAIASTNNAPAGGFIDGVNNTTVTITTPYPPAPPNYTGGPPPPTCAANPTSCALVTITRQVPTHFLPIVGKEHITVSRTGIAAVTTVAGVPCVLCVLDPAAAGAFNDTGGATVTVLNGGVVVNSTSSTGTTLGSNATVNATGGTISLVGNWNQKGTLSPTPLTHAPPAPDPLAALAAPSLAAYTSCPNVTASGQTNTVITPGCYNTLSVTGNGALLLQPGLYIITGQVKNTGNGSGGIQGAGVTLYVTCGGNAPSSCATGGGSGGTINIGGSGYVNLSAPTSGTYQGVTVFYDRNNSAGLSIVGNGSQLSGTVYAKSSTMTITGNSGNMADNSLIVVDQFFFNGTTGFTDNFTPGSNYPHPQKLGPAKLVQ
jgi:hypothetical protein